MSRLTWGAPETRFFDTGLDRGVLYRRGLPPGALIAKNYVYNPTAKNGDLRNWGPYGTGTVVDHTISQGQDAFLVKKTAAGSQLGMRTPASPPGMYPRMSGSPVTIQAEVLNPTGQAFTTIGFIGRDDTNNDSTVLDGVATSGARQWTVPANGQWMRIHLTTTVKAGRTLQSIYVEKSPPGGALVTENFLVRNVMVSATTELIPYFDGDTPNDLYDYTWVGEPNNSISEKHAAVSSAVPWSGLTGVEEQGGEGAASYYIDGRPFLFLPKPKEYQATLKAFTYPDEFSAVMGVAEATDGMYLDSQPGEVFDLSYRTLVGNAVDGVNHGYKIHLVYNATVTPQSMSYDTISSSVNPTEFSWDIQAVPVRVEGFRPTAHVIIDTRHMDESTIASLEALLYGDESHVANMPSPQVIFDLLSFGDVIIVTDMGDGTFTVEGAYENVYMIGPGEFRVDNVDGQVNADGTFVISSTNA